MAQLDRRVPAVYIDIEDRSYISEGNDLDRSAYICIVSDRGPHNRIVEINSWDQFELLFGSPNFEKTGHAHYLAYQHLKWANRLYVCRPVLEDVYMANVAIKYNDPNGSSQIIYGQFTFTNGSNIVETNEYGIDDAKVGEYIYSVADTYLEAAQIHSIVNDPSTNTYQYILETNYTGTSVSDNMYVFYPGSTIVSGNFQFDNGSNIVTVNPLSAIDDVNIGDWVYPDTLDYQYARQIIEKNVYTGELTLDDNFNGADTTSALRNYIPFQTVSIASVTDDTQFLETDIDNLWYFYANGVGEYYNNLFIRGIRNVEYESIYTDDDGNPLYKYAFVNLALYEKQVDGSSKIVAGPWPVSLIPQTTTGDIIRDITTGQELYIENVINRNQELIRCKSALGIDQLLDINNLELSETKRLQVMSMLSEGYVIKTEVIGQDGISLENGTNGSQYDSSGRLNLASNTLFRGIIAQAYEGTLESVDGTIENIKQVVYPWYIFDYIYCGGYDPIIENSARSLADTRDDCLVLADTGYYSNNANTDIGYRQTSVPWNTYNAMLYSQYRKIDDIFTGKSFYITPVYHAIDRHLYCDARYWLAEPVANIEKGAVQDRIELAYKPSLTKIGDLIDVEINPTISEPDGTYFITQLTTWKRLSVMKRAHVVKFIHFLKHKIPTLCKDILQHKATRYWVNQIYSRINSFMFQFTDFGSFDKYVAITKYEVLVDFDEQASEAMVLLSIWPIRAIEKITVRIVVY